MKRSPIILLACLVVSACDDASNTPSDVKVVDIAPINAVQTGALSGRLTVVAGDGYRVEISSATTLADVDVQVTVDETGQLQLQDDARDGQFVFYRLTVPATTPLTLDVEDGDVSISDLRAGVAIDVGRGEVALERIAGDISVRVGSGDVYAYDLATAHFTARVEDGDLDASSVTAPERLDLDASGQVFVALPIHAYDLDLSAGGALDIGLLSDVDASARRLTIRAGGDISLLDLAPQDCRGASCADDHAAWRASQM